MSWFKFPKEWKHIKLQDVAIIQTGIAKGGKHSSNTISLPYLRVANVQDGHLDLSEIKYIDVPKDMVNRYSLQKDDVLLTEGGDFDKLGRGTIWKNEIPNCVHQNHIFVVRTDKNRLLPCFLEYISSSHIGRTYFLSCSKQTTNLASINSTQLKHMPLAIPSLAEQKKIAEILGAWDKGVEKTEKLIGAKQKHKKALMQQLLTGKKRFKEFKGQRCKNISLESICKNFINGGTPSTQISEYWNGTIPWITGADFLDQKIGVIRRKISHAAVKDSSTNVIKKGGLLVVTRTGVGKIAIAPFDVAISQDITGLYLDSQMCDIHFIYHYLGFSSLGFAKYNQGTSISGITRDDLKKHKVHLPSFKEQQKIASALNAMVQEIDLLQKKLEAIKKQKKGLMQKLLTGKIRVKV